MLFANKKSPHLAVRAERKIKPEKTLSKKMFSDNRVTGDIVLVSLQSIF